MLDDVLGAAFVKGVCVGSSRDYRRQGMKDRADVLWKLTVNGFHCSIASLSSAATKGSGGLLKFIVAVGEALGTTPSAGNNCIDDGPVLGGPFIQPWWSDTPHCGIQSTSGRHSSVHSDSS
jgi:hypothetical protein